MALLKHPSTKLPVRLLARPGAVGLLESPDGLSLLMTEVRKDVVLSIGDVVVTSLGRAGVPPNLPVGTVLAIERQPQGLWQEVAVAPLVEPATLDVVAVLLPP
jgi:cell shape-determining protein MreC